MGIISAVLGILVPYAPWVALGLLLFGGFAAAKSGLAGGTTVGVLWLAVLLGLVAVFLWLAGFPVYSFLTFLVAVVVGIADGLHERRITRRGYARMRG
jgi:hypothetical protein